GGGEVQLGGGALLVGAEVHVVVGQHGPAAYASTLPASSSSATRRSSWVVTLRFARGASTIATVPPAASTRPASSVAAASVAASTSSAARSRSAQNTWGVWIAQSVPRSSVRTT